ncbi:DUF1993 family protein [Longimicrobium sp.]|uniref:DUF1993 family protein n=1 Tax=Longimicrobium sp. TaxID=2029185 RepID=UPI002E36CB44|nr:DUF1993 family protein [Longimicrobium sp.]HEX6036695.1 DUF1993 family protein [Longimicrobium sp.]
MSLNAYDVSAGVFIRGLTNLKAQLAKAEAQAAASGRDAATLLDARLGRDGDGASGAPYDLHMYTLAAHVHWAAEGARLAIANVLGAHAVPDTSEARSFSDLHQRLDSAIAEFRKVAAADLDAGLGRTVVIEHRRGSASGDGRQFLLALALPHFFYHVTTAYGILRNEGVQLTMGDFLGNWTAA